jgi:FMN phosphatase YigB (HAD superfamily)
LRSQGIHLDHSTVFAHEVAWRSSEPARFRSGVLFVGETNDKGKLLLELLRRLGLRPSRIVFIDDKVKNVRSVDQALRQAKIPSMVFRYGAADARVKAFNERTR